MGDHTCGSMNVPLGTRRTANAAVPDPAAFAYSIMMATLQGNSFIVPIPPGHHTCDSEGGGGAVVTEEGETPLHPECAVLVLPDEAHCFRAGDEGLKFLCLVPLGEATKGR